MFQTDVNYLLGTRISKARFAFPAMTLELVANFLQITADEFAEFEAGNARPSPDQIILMANLMDVTPSWFFDGHTAALKAPVHR